MKKYKWLLLLCCCFLVCWIVWGYYGFGGGFILGSYNSKTKKFKISKIMLGKVALEPDPFKRDYICLALKFPFKKKGLIDTNGKIVVPIKYDDIGWLEENGWATVETKDKWGLYNIATGAEVKPISSIPFYFHGYNVGMFSVDTKGAKRGLINTEGKIILEAKYKNVSSELRYFAFVKDSLQKPNLSVYDRKLEKFIINGEYEFVKLDWSKFPLLIARKSYKQMYLIHKNTLSVIPKDYLLVYLNDSNIAKNQWLVKTLGSKSLTERIDWENSNSQTVNGVDGFYVDNSKFVPFKLGVINSLGNDIVYPNYDNITEFAGKYYKVTVNKKQGLVDTLGKVIVKPVYQAISYYKRLNLFKLTKTNGKTKCITANGIVIFSEKIKVIKADLNASQLVFKHQKHYYQLKYENNKYTWHRQQ